MPKTSLTGCYAPVPRNLNPDAFELIPGAKAPDFSTTG